MSEQTKDVQAFDNIKIMTAEDTELYGMLHKYKEDGLSGDRVFRDRAILSNNFYNGYQWDRATLEELNRKKMPPLTFNIIKKTVEFLVGTQEQNRKDITVKPVKNGQNSIASILTKIVKDVITKNNAEHLFSEWFRQGCVKGRGFIHAYRDFELDPWTGDLKLEVVDALDCSIDPLSKRYDLSDSKYFIVFKYTNRDEVIESYPKHSKALRNLRTGDDDDQYNEDIFLDGGGDLDSDALNSEESRYSDRTTYRFRIQWTYINRTERRTHLLDMEEMTDTILHSKEAIDGMSVLAVQNPNKYKVIERADKILYLVKSVNDIILERVREPFKKEDENDEFYRNPMNKIPVIPFGAHFDNGRWEGIVDDLIIPQQEKNKLRSLILHIIGTTANSGWVYKEGSLDDEEERKLRTAGAQTGLNLKYKTEAPSKIEANQLPTGIFALAEQSNADINDISGVNAANLGATQAQESGKLNELRQIQGITTNTGVFDNLDYSMKLLGELIVGVIRSTELYTVQEIEAIVEDFDMFDDKTMAEATQILDQQQPIPSLDEVMRQADATDPESQQIIMQEYQKVMEQRQQVSMQIAKQIVMSNLHNLYKGRYGISIAMSNFSPTAKSANMNMLFEMSRILPGIIPADYLIKQSDLPDKEIILKEIQRRAQAAQQAEQAKIRAEIEGKVLIQRAKNEGSIAQENVKGKNNFIANQQNQE
jgi:hypothetical protein